VKHSFTNPEADQLAARFNLPLAYDRQADEDSWMQTARVLKDSFGQGK
jgi:dienelactone hydrolase